MRGGGGNIRNKHAFRAIFKRPPFMQMYNGYKTGARVRKLEFTLTPQQFKSLIDLPCFYCGSAPRTTLALGYKDLVCNGIDRVDNSLGYIPSNCVPCCSRHNRMKGTLSVEEFVELCRSVVQHLG